MSKRILIFATTYFPLVGGAEVAMKEITDRIPDMRFDLVCAQIKPGLAKTEQIGNITVHRVGFGMAIDKLLLPFLGPVRAWRRGGASEFSGVWSLMASFGGFAALFYVWMCPKSPFLLTLQEGDPLEHYQRRARGLGWLQQQIFRRADTVQVISRFLGRWAVARGFKGTPEIVPNGVDLTTFLRSIDETSRESLRTHFGFNKNDIVLVSASRLSHKNALDDLIVSLTHLPSTYKVLLLGVGEDEQKLRALAQEKNVTDRVVFAGHVEHDVLPATLQSADIFVRASRSEGLGISFLEAMACGVPIVGTDVGGMPDFLTDEQTGVVCRVNDPASIAHAVQRIQEDSALRMRIIQTARELIQEQYGWDRIAGRMERLLRKTIDSHRPVATPAWFRVVVAVIIAATLALGAYTACRAWAMAPLYFNATMRQDVQAIAAQWREETGFGLSQFLLQSVQCKGDDCVMDVVVRTRLAPPNPTREHLRIQWSKGAPQTYVIVSI